MADLGQTVRRIVLGTSLAAMPVGVPVDAGGADSLVVGLHGGGGQVVSVLRDCEGNQLAAAKGRYVDVTAGVELNHRFESGIVGVIGIRGGYLDSDLGWPAAGVYTDDREPLRYSYANPYVAIETRNVGIGFGYVSGAIPFDLGDNTGSVPMSAHLRIGRRDALQIRLSLNENLPLASGGGFVNLGVGYPVGRGVRLYSGASTGFYDGWGLVQKAAVPLSARFALDLCARFGSAAGAFEGGFAAGLRYNLLLR
jgi:hypothetical protein